jgi:Tol biopolymer transport system component/DNA-binding SARP family transcriptional activator
VRTDQAADEEALSNSKTLLILALLATRPGHSARRADVAELLWPDSDRARALRALRQAVFFLSGHADEVLGRTEDTLTLDPEVVSVDLWDFDRAIAAGDHATAIELARGPFAAGQERKVGSEAEHWIEAVNARIAVGLEVAYAREIERARVEGDGARAVRLARAFAALNPLDEERQGLLARTLLAAGDQVGALQTLEEYRQVSAQTLGEALPPELEARLQAVRDDLRRGAAPVIPARPADAPPDDRERRVSGPVFTVRGHPVTRTALITVGGVALFALIIILALPRKAPPAADSLAGLEAGLLAVARTGNTLRVLELAVRDTTVTVTERKELQPTDLPAPDGRTVATTFQAPQGWDLAVRPGSDSQRVLTSAPGDEYPVEWSPDSRYLIYAHRRLLADGRTQSFALGVVDLTADTAWRLAPALESREFPTAAWSPDGTRIVFTGDVRGEPDVFLAGFTGASPRNLTRHIAWDGDPSWAPDGGQIAFVSRRGRNADVYSVRPDGTDLRRLTRTDTDERRPLWVSSTVLAMLVGDDEERDLQLLDTFTGQDRRVDGAPPGLVALVARPDRSRPWLDRLAIAPRVRQASPGQHLTLEAQATGSTGEPFPTALPIEWSVSDSEIARVEGPGLVRILGAGPARIVASAAGWRGDTLTVFSVPLAERVVTPVFVEDWTGGLHRERWRPFGDPIPRARRTGGPDGSGVFTNRGDAFFASGAVTHEAFPLRGGLGVEVEGRMSFTGKLHQEFAVALYETDHPDSTLASGTAPALVEFRVRGPSGAAAAEAWIATPDRRVALPLPPRPDAWHTYTLQVLTDGGLELIVDGQLLWRAPEPMVRQAESVRIGLGYQSFETEILHGRLRIYTPPRYYLPDVTLEDDSLPDR